MPRLDQQLQNMCSAVGLDLDEMDTLFDETNSVSAVLVRIAEAEAAMFAEQARAEAAAREAAEAAGIPMGVGSQRWRRRTGASFSLSVRLDHDEVAELRRRATERGIGVSVLARSYIRGGLLGR